MQAIDSMISPFLPSFYHCQGIQQLMGERKLKEVIHIFKPPIEHTLSILS